jgi:hypothetical protein
VCNKQDSCGECEMRRRFKKEIKDAIDHKGLYGIFAGMGDNLICGPTLVFKLGPDEEPIPKTTISSEHINYGGKVK